MINIEKQVPQVYYDLSRDFQFLGRLFEVVLNSVKTNADLLYEIPEIEEANSKLIDLFMLSMGFKPRHNYDITQLTAISSIFLTLLKNKGTLRAIELAGNAALNAAGVVGEIRCVVQGSKISIQVPAELTDTNLFYDMLSYILPAGMSCAVVKAIFKTENQVTETLVASKPKSMPVKDYVLGVIKPIDLASGDIKYNAAALLDDKTYGAIAENTIMRKFPSKQINPEEGIE